MRSMPFSGTLREFRANRRGNFAMMFALMAMPLLLAAGTAVDITHAYANRADMANALDAAVLSTAKALSDGSIQQADATGYLQQMFMGNLVSTPLDTSRVVVGPVDFNGTSNTLSAQVTYDYRASFGVLGRGGDFPLTAKSAASYGDGRAEVAMAFDLTGSMQGAKIAALRTAAENGIEKLLAANSSTDPRIRIAAIPYAAAVNVGPDLAKYVFPDDGKPNTVAPDYDPTAPVSKSKKIADACATERKGPEQFTDVGPDKGMINRDKRLDFRRSLPERPDRTADDGQGQIGDGDQGVHGKRNDRRTHRHPMGLVHAVGQVGELHARRHRSRSRRPETA